MDLEKENAMRFGSLSMSPKVLFAACSDDRLPVLSFLEQELILPEGFYFPLRLAGGLSPLAHKNEVPDDFDSTLRQARIITHKPTIRTAIVLEHSDCTYRKAHFSDLADMGIKDLETIADVLLENLPQLTQVQLWFAQLLKSEREWDFTKVKVVSRELVCQT